MAHWAGLRGRGPRSVDAASEVGTGATRLLAFRADSGGGRCDRDLCRTTVLSRVSRSFRLLKIRGAASQRETLTKC